MTARHNIQSFFIALLCVLSFYVTHAQSNCATFSTYFGGTQFDELKGVCVDANKNSYVIGNTYSSDFPITTGLIHDSNAGSYDVVLAKFDSCGVLIWSTYYGSANFDSGEKIALTSDGNLIITGYTSGVNTPTTPGCFQAQNNGGYDCFLAKVSANGFLIWSTYFGKSAGDFAFDVKVDAFDNIIIGGTTLSTNLYTTASSFQQLQKGNTDAFIARFSKFGQLKWCTYYGGNNNEDIHALAIDANFNILGVGETFSSNLSTSVGAFQNIKEGTNDAYIIKLDSNCQRIFSTYLGGNNSDDAWGVATDAQGQVYVAGHTSSTDFDVTSSVYQSANNGGFDWYVSKWSATGALLISTLYGGSMDEKISQMIISFANNLILIGYTSSNNMPLFGVGNQINNAGSSDVFIATVSTNSLTPFWSSYYGGTLDDFAADVKLKGISELTFVGNSNSVNYPLSLTPHQSVLNLSNDGVITKLTLYNQLPTQIPLLTRELIHVLPNPFSETIQIQGVENFDYVITDVLGKTMTSQTNTNKKSINTEFILSGVYFLTIKTPIQNFTYKLIKQ